MRRNFMYRIVEDSEWRLNPRNVDGFCFDGRGREPTNDKNTSFWGDPVCYSTPSPTKMVGRIHKIYLPHIPPWPVSFNGAWKASRNSSPPSVIKSSSGGPMFHDQVAAPREPARASMRRSPEARESGTRCTWPNVHVQAKAFLGGTGVDALFQLHSQSPG